MALKLTFDICVTNGCTVFKLSELTGQYSATNLTGYGYTEDNPPTEVMASATLTIISPSNITYTVDVMTQFNWPTSNPYLFANITAESLGLTTLEDGLWIFTYTLVEEDTGTIYSTTKNYLNFCTSNCCVSQMLANLNLDECGCECNDVQYENYLKAWVQLEGLKNAAKCGDIESFNNIKKIVDKLCKNINCKTCK